MDTTDRPGQAALLSGHGNASTDSGSARSLNGLLVKAPDRNSTHTPKPTQESPLGHSHKAGTDVYFCSGAVTMVMDEGNTWPTTNHAVWSFPLEVRARIHQENC